VLVNVSELNITCVMFAACRQSGVQVHQANLIYSYARLRSIVSMMIATVGPMQQAMGMEQPVTFAKFNGIPQGIEREGSRGKMA
jgi:hypothetical protein